MELNQKEQLKYNVISDVVNGTKSKKEAEIELNLSRKQINRLIIKFNKDGKNGFIHKSRGRKSHKKTSKDVKEKIVNLYLNEYYDFNFSHFYEKVKDEIEPSFQTVYRILNNEDIISPVAQHKTIKLYNEKLKNAIKSNSISEEKKDFFQKREELEKEKNIRKSTLLYSFGQQIQMDASSFIWFGNISSALHLAVDRATKKVLYGWFDLQETNNAYYVLLMNIILNYGIPSLIRTDKRGCFSINNSNFVKSNINLTQFGRICKELGIVLKSESNPLFKPNVERENRTFKGRLKAELRHENITTIDDANKYLNEIFIPDLNKRFSYDINDEKNDMRDNIYTRKELNIIISERYVRTIDNASSIKYKTNYYVPINIDTGEVMYFKNKTTCIVTIAYDKSIWGFINNNLYFLLQVEKQKIKNESKSIKTVYKGHKPPINHIWNFEQQTKMKKKYQELKMLRKTYK